MVTRIVCVDPDDESRRETVEQLETELADLNPRVEPAETRSKGIERLTRDTDAVVTEYDLPDGTGFDVIEAAQTACPDAGCLLYTATDLSTVNTPALGETTAEYVGKGSLFGAERLTDLVRTTVERRAQSSYPVPQTEDERLAALQAYELDDAGLLDSLERITELAATQFAVEKSSINLITEHTQEFLTCHGASWETMEREDSICTFTILEDDDVMTVEDVTEDPRFESRSDLFLQVGIRSYMGANLVTPAGLVIGPLCVYDDEPRRRGRVRVRRWDSAQSHRPGNVGDRRRASTQPYQRPRPVDGFAGNRNRRGDAVYLDEQDPRQTPDCLSAAPPRS